MHGATARGALRATLRAGKGKKPRLGAIQTAATPTDGTLAQGLPPLRDNNTQGGEGGGKLVYLKPPKPNVVPDCAPPTAASEKRAARPLCSPAAACEATLEVRRRLREAGQRWWECGGQDVRALPRRVGCIQGLEQL